ncbi:MAG: SOS response-associated peptidase family protein, partial [Deltaproteobacteria bacterium]|nr:SOS response-associated peptidase family protein [Deltaproteobacteria bacterium]
PYLFRRTDGKIFVMAGLWQDGRYVVLTQDSAGEVADVHCRMPVLLHGAGAHQWLTQGKLADPPDLTRTPVSLRVNQPENDDPTCLSPLPQTTFDFD